MSDIEIVAPTTKEEIELYISNDGSQCGVSISGLARLCGVKRQSLQELINYLSEDTPAGKSTPESLKDALGNVFTPQLEGVNGAKIINDIAATAIIDFYAHDSKAKNETALKSLRAFTRKGFKTWVKESVGFVEPVKQNNDLGIEQWKVKALEELLGEVKELKKIVNESNGFKKATVTLPGLRYQFDGYAEQGQCDEEELKMLDSGYFTLDEWLKSKGVFLEHGQKCGLGRIVASIYKVNKQTEPKRILGNKLPNPVKGRVTVYQQSDIPMLEAALIKYQKINN